MFARSFCARLGVLAGAAASMLLAGSSPAHAQRVQANYTGVITSVEDPFNVFNNTIVVGGAVQGSFTYVPSQFQNLPSIPPLPDSQALYRYVNSLNDGSITANIGGVSIRTYDFERLYADIYNNEPGVGDFFRINAPSGFPIEYNDGGPNYDVFYVDAAFLGISLTDPTGSAFSSLDFPLSVPNFADFSTREGFLFLFVVDSNTGDYVTTEARFRLTSLTPAASAVPEPGSCALLASGGIGGLMLSRRRRRAVRR